MNKVQLLTHAVILSLALFASGLAMGYAGGLPGDVNGDGQADSTDALLILQADAGLLQRAVVLRVLDGDTIEVNLDGVTERVRYYSIDAPELVQPGGQAARQANMRLTSDGVVLTRGDDGRDRDSFGRLLRHAYTASGLWIEAQLVEGGHAIWR